MLSQFFHAQWNNPGRFDWVETVKEDIMDLGLPSTLVEIQGLSTGQFKSLVKSRCIATAFNQLLKQKSLHSKMVPLSYEELRIQTYFTDGTLHSGDAKLLFSFRTRMVDVRCNYRSKHTTVSCPLCQTEDDTQEHLLVCPKINTQPSAVIYSDIFGCDPDKRNSTFRALKSAFERREEALKN
jgi:hypothetical protein